jgi:hypothetical protein
MILEAAMALQAGLSYYQADQANKQAKDRNKLNKAKADSDNKTRATQNIAAIQADQLSRWVQSVNNKMALKSGGASLDANTINTLRRQTDRAGGAFANSVQQAEAFGAQVATSAHSGTTGSVVGIVAGSMALRDSIVKENYRRIGITETSDAQQRAGVIYSQMVNGLDHSIITPSLNWNISQPDVYNTQSDAAIAASTLLPAVATAVMNPSITPPNSTPTSAPLSVGPNGEWGVPVISTSRKFTWDTSIAPGANDPMSLWVTGGTMNGLR